MTADRPETEPLERIRWVPLAIVVLSVVAVVQSSFEKVVIDQGVLAIVEGFFWNAVPLSFGVAGALILWRQPRNPIGWILMIPCLAYATLLMPATMSGSPPAVVTIWVVLQTAFDQSSWTMFVFPLFALLLIFPTGSLVSRRWRWLMWLLGLMALTFPTLMIFSARVGPTEQDWSVANPWGFISDDFFEAIFGVVWLAGLVVLVLGGLAAVIVRFRRGSPVEREQVKWFLFATSAFALFYIVSAMISSFEDLSVVSLLLAVSTILVPTSILIAVTRYRLFEIDRIIGRTVAYTIVIVLLGGIFVGVVSLMALFVPSEDPVLVAAATLAAAASFNPLRRRVQRMVDRRFNRTRYDPETVMGQLVESLRNTVETESVLDSWQSTVVSTMEPRSIGVWLKPR